MAIAGVSTPARGRSASCDRGRDALDDTGRRCICCHLDPKVYRLKVVEDINSNTEWDTGNYFQKSQPEKVLYYPEPITVRANWDVDVAWVVGN